MRERDYRRFRERLFTEQLDNGLTVCLLPKPGYAQVFATFTTQYGSIDNVFRRRGEPEYTTVPEGIAHFLEHKMFETPKGDAFSEFGRNGATANAYTSFDETTYLFSSTEHVDENLRILLDFVQEPYFTEQGIEKEKGIISQELRMYEDDPDRRSLAELFRGLYYYHPVRSEIGGTVESIQAIDRDTLLRCYQTFYHPSNMLLFVVGGFEPEPTMELIRTNQAAKAFGPAPGIDRFFPQEPADVLRHRVDAKLSVSRPRCLIGWKDAKTGLSGRTLLERELQSALILDVLFGRSSDAYHTWVDEGLVDQAFGWECDLTPTYGFALVGGNTGDPDELVRRVNEVIARAATDGLPEREFERARRKAIGRFVAGLDSPYAIAHNWNSYYFKAVDWFDTVSTLEALTWERSNELIGENLVEAKQTVSVIVPDTLDG